MVKARISLEDMRALAFPIIPYQVITGNYDNTILLSIHVVIIPYQVITGNYDVNPPLYACLTIIPYQVITGNYDMQSGKIYDLSIIPYQVITGNYDFSQLVVSKIKTAHEECNMIRLLSLWAVS